MSDTVINTTFLEKEIQEWKKEMYRKENSDDFYHTKGSYRADAAYVRDLERQLREIKEGKKQ